MPLPTFKILTKGQITESALRELRLKKCICWPQNNLPVRGRKFIGRRGVSDIIGITPAGLFLAVEVKTVNDFLSDDQITFLNDVAKAGGVAYIATQEGNQVVLKEWEVKKI